MTQQRAQISQAFEDWPQLSGLLDEALALPPAARERWLTGLAARHEPYRASLRTLLAVQAQIETDAFLATGPRLPVVTLGCEPAAGSTVGAYRLLRELGRGGMSTVWEAQHTDWTAGSCVALKLPRVSWDGAYAARLASESRILAGLDHPHIARLLEAGTDALGRPYLAMAAINGQPINDFCTARGSSLRERIALLLQVMSAVAFAHDRLVVHRDLKPANIMVDDSGHAWLLDFGVAKLLAGEAPAVTGLTERFGRAMTLDYASPEQILGEPQTAASDIYSMGVVAYELLAGSRPHRPKRASAAALEEAITARDPPLASVAAREQSTKRLLRGALDAILRRALKRKPADRYPTMVTFVMDLRLCLARCGVAAHVANGLTREQPR